ncbi:MAG TPA: carboxymuconolactone decarboxylase family protein [Microbacterium sp.]|uniref:carboxymuconolactone decarboxylase family protein n=1 Tax=Microbacterium sp. TaxID=51671 RepID=UPI002BB5B879|nr:carboxymuconolactone decarboxylase family protein [Microbacterium sp.]HWI30955.1 carboxymuconolactone decarboxylase family protein [Microbacterium sp.]
MKRPSGQLSRRLAALHPEVWDAEQSAFAETLVRGPRGRSVYAEDGSLFVLFDALLRAPGAGDRLQALGLAVQGLDAGAPTALPLALREAVICAVVAHRGCATELRTHAPKARAAGITADELAAIEEGRGAEVLPQPIAAALGLTGRLLDQDTLTDTEYDAFRTVLGEQAIVAIVILVGYYELVSALFRTFALDSED